MKKTLVSLTMVALAAMTTIAGAQTHKKHPASKTVIHMIACPVTGEKVDIAKATKAHMYADYKGNRYFFCCGDCPPMFKKNPAKYAKKPHIPTPKTHKR